MTYDKLCSNGWSLSALHIPIAARWPPACLAFQVLRVSTCASASVDLGLLSAFLSAELHVKFVKSAVLCWKPRSNFTPLATPFRWERICTLPSRNADLGRLRYRILIVTAIGIVSASIQFYMSVAESRSRSWELPVFLIRLAVISPIATHPITPSRRSTA